MLLAKIENNNIVKYPYSERELHLDNPNTSFMTPLILGDVVEYGVIEVKEVNPPSYDADVYKLEEGAPSYNEVSGEWEQSWSTVLLSIEEQELQRLNQADWLGFYNALLVSTVFNHLRTQATLHLSVNVAYTDTANALALAAQGTVNVAAIQACFNNALSSLDSAGAPLSTTNLDELNSLLSSFHLNLLLTI